MSESNPPRRLFARPGAGGESIPIGLLNRTRIDNFLRRMAEVLPRRVTRADFWRVAGYREATQFERWQRGRHVSAGSAARFENVLRLPPERFLEKLRLVRPLKRSLSPQFPPFSDVRVLIDGGGLSASSIRAALAAGKMSPVSISIQLTFGNRRRPSGRVEPEGQLIRGEEAAQLLVDLIHQGGQRRRPTISAAGPRSAGRANVTTGGDRV